MLLPLDNEGWETPTWEHFLQLAIEEEERGEVTHRDPGRCYDLTPRSFYDLLGWKSVAGFLATSLDELSAVFEEPVPDVVEDLVMLIGAVHDIRVRFSDGSVRVWLKTYGPHRGLFQWQYPADA